MPILVHVDSPRDELDVVVEDDGRVAYAYLREGGTIVGDVWLYNVGAAPQVPEWSDPERMPFRNPVPFVAPGEFTPIGRHDEVTVTWDLELGVTATLSIRGRIHAVLRHGEVPGRCVLATRRSPLARPLDPGDGSER